MRTEKSESGKFSWRNAVAAGVASGLVVLGVTRPWADPTPAPPAAAGPTSPAAGPGGINAVFCDAVSGEHCARLLADLGARAPLTDEQRRAAEATAEQAVRTFTAAPAGATADAMRRALAEAGFTNAVVRASRPDDPAPAGGLLAAVADGRACILLFEDATGPHGHVGGQLPGGGCLRG